MDYYGNNDWRDYIAHYGTPRHSGRYPWGSGQNPRQGTAHYYVPKTSNGNNKPSGRIYSTIVNGNPLPGRVYDNLNHDTSKPFPTSRFFSNPDGSSLKPSPEELKKKKVVPGFKLKTKEYTLDEDIERTNPKNGNVNCMCCTTALEMRRRGYEVSAKVTEHGYPDYAILEWFKNVDINLTNDLHSWDDYFSSVKRASSYFGNTKLEKNVIKDLKSQGVGARGNLMCTLSLYSGHSVMYEVTKKGVVLYDGQQNQKYTEQETRKALRRMLGVATARYDTAEPILEGMGDIIENYEGGTHDMTKSARFMTTRPRR